jgi:hypothetical protein
MSRDGSGNYSLPAGNPVVYGTDATDTWANTTMSDIAAALTGSFAADGQTQATGNFDLGSNKIVSLAKGTNDSDAAIVGQLFHKNLVINGNFAINQRAYSSGTSLGATEYGHDRWRGGASGGTYTFTQSYPYTTITITAGSLRQVIRDVDVVGGSYVLSWSGTATGRINSGSYASSPVTATGLSANTQIVVEFSTGTLGKVQFEQATSQTDFELVDFQTEKLRCFAYYFKTTDFASGNFFAGDVTSGAGYRSLGRFPVPMIGTPSVTLSNAGAVTGFGNTPGTPDLITNMSYREARTATANATGSYYASVYTADAEIDP